MKKRNGFTLIELLAVIIILGVIMLIAIPSVTQQITNSRKNSYVDTAQSYVKAIVTRVNEGDLDLFDTETVYLLPVGNNEAKSCISLESGGASPFSKSYHYAYVAVHYTGNSYDYWFMAEDGSKQGIVASSTKTLESDGKKLVYSNLTEVKLSGSDTLQTVYDGAVTKEYDATAYATIKTNNPTSATTNGNKQFGQMLTDLGTDVKKMKIYGATACKSA